MFGRNKIAMLVAEFLGTGILTLLVLSVQRSTIGVPFFVALAAGLTVMLVTFALGNVSGAHLNPAVTIGLWTVRKVSTLTGIVYIAAQLLGAWVAYYLYTYYVNSHLQPVGGHFSWRIFVAEGVGAAIFVFAWVAAAYQRYTSGLSAAVVGLAYMLGIIAASSAAIGLLNPALALGIRAWVWGTYVLAPVAGAVVGANLYTLFFADEAAIGGFNVMTGAPVAVATRPVAATSAAAATKRPAAKKRTTSRKRK